MKKMMKAFIFAFEYTVFVTCPLGQQIHPSGKSVETAIQGHPNLRGTRQREQPNRRPPHYSQLSYLPGQGPMSNAHRQMRMAGVRYNGRVGTLLGQRVRNHRFSEKQYEKKSYRFDWPRGYYQASQQKFALSAQVSAWYDSRPVLTRTKTAYDGDIKNQKVSPSLNAKTSFSGAFNTEFSSLKQALQKAYRQKHSPAQTIRHQQNLERLLRYAKDDPRMKAAFEGSQQAKQKFKQIQQRNELLLLLQQKYTQANDFQAARKVTRTWPQVSLIVRDINLKVDQMGRFVNKYKRSNMKDRDYLHRLQQKINSIQDQIKGLNEPSKQAICSVLGYDVEHYIWYAKLHLPTIQIPAAVTQITLHPQYFPDWAVMSTVKGLYQSISSSLRRRRANDKSLSRTDLINFDSLFLQISGMDPLSRQLLFDCPSIDFKQAYQDAAKIKQAKIMKQIQQQASMQQRVKKMHQLVVFYQLCQSVGQSMPLPQINQKLWQAKLAFKLNHVTLSLALDMGEVATHYRQIVTGLLINNKQKVQKMSKDSPYYDLVIRLLQISQPKAYRIHRNSLQKSTSLNPFSHVGGQIIIGQELPLHKKIQRTLQRLMIDNKLQDPKPSAPEGIVLKDWKQNQFGDSQDNRDNIEMLLTMIASNIQTYQDTTKTQLQRQYARTLLIAMLQDVVPITLSYLKQFIGPIQQIVTALKNNQPINKPSQSRSDSTGRKGSTTPAQDKSPKTLFQQKSKLRKRILGLDQLSRKYHLLNDEQFLQKRKVIDQLVTKHKVFWEQNSGKLGYPKHDQLVKRAAYNPIDTQIKKKMKKFFDEIKKKKSLTPQQLRKLKKEFYSFGMMGLRIQRRSNALKEKIAQLKINQCSPQMKNLLDRLVSTWQQLMSQRDFLTQQKYKQYSQRLLSIWNDHKTLTNVDEQITLRKLLLETYNHSSLLSFQRIVEWKRLKKIEFQGMYGNVGDSVMNVITKPFQSTQLQTGLIQLLQIAKSQIKSRKQIAKQKAKRQSQQKGIQIKPQQCLPEASQQILYIREVLNSKQRNYAKRATVTTAWFQALLKKYAITLDTERITNQIIKKQFAQVTKLLNQRKQWKQKTKSADKQFDYDPEDLKDPTIHSLLKSITQRQETVAKIQAQRDLVRDKLYQMIKAIKYDPHNYQLCDLLLPYQYWRQLEIALSRSQNFDGQLLQRTSNFLKVSKAWTVLVNAMQNPVFAQSQSVVATLMKFPYHSRAQIARLLGIDLGEVACLSLNEMPFTQIQHKAQTTLQSRFQTAFAQVSVDYFKKKYLELFAKLQNQNSQQGSFGKVWPIDGLTQLENTQLAFGLQQGRIDGLSGMAAIKCLMMWQYLQHPSLSLMKPKYLETAFPAFKQNWTFALQTLFRSPILTKKCTVQSEMKKIIKDNLFFVFRECILKNNPDTLFQRLQEGSRRNKKLNTQLIELISHIFGIKDLTRRYRVNGPTSEPTYGRAYGLGLRKQYITRLTDYRRQNHPQ